MHAISSILKAKHSWSTNELILACREVLAGHGYSTFNRLGYLLMENGMNFINK